MITGGLACCGITALYGFPYDNPQPTPYDNEQIAKLEEAVKLPAGGIEQFLAGGGCQLCAVTDRQKRALEILKANGFREIATVKTAHIDNYRIHFLMRGATVEKVILKKKKVA